MRPMTVQKIGGADRDDTMQTSGPADADREAMTATPRCMECTMLGEGNMASLGGHSLYSNIYNISYYDNTAHRIPVAPCPNTHTLYAQGRAQTDHLDGEPEVGPAGDHRELVRTCRFEGGV